ncbi:uroporphyrinogen decarboxylase family protein [Phosphitispora fastidiosa]|uniref:uroporphyrinogen decarboxylase family protein n=1 Tax=Phosphitispora fastidiosa TaxID=2837202 RepID=UPI001E4DCDF4|nr:uroporphyrinogen decarboxylase family protein [Phosphitispora fastidiosa]MBU7007940.1 uroporphyrinogen decarboxylase [Phosphitispora fastidiosa]
MKIPEDRMTPKERIGSLLQGKPIDRVPCVPVILNGCCTAAGYTVKEMTLDGEKFGKANVATYRKYGYDMICLLDATATTAEAAGTKLCYPDNAPAYVEDPLIKSVDDVKKLRPLDPTKDGRLNNYLVATEYCVSEVGSEVFVGTLFAGPFTTAACLRGTETLVRDCYKNKDLVHQLVRWSTDVTIVFLEEVIKRGGVPVLCEPVGTGSILSLKMFTEYIEPYFKEIHEFIKSKGLPVLDHICGDCMPILESWMRTEPTVLSVDRVDIGEVSQRVGDRVGVMGNVTPGKTLFMGTPESVDAEVKEVMDKAGKNPCGFVLASGCEVPVGTPPENITAMMNAARKYGQHPLT